MNVERGTWMAREIAAQPAVFKRILDEGRARIGEVAATVRARRPRFVLFAARGTSDHAALYAKYLVEIRLGLPAGLVSPSTSTIYEAQPRLDGGLFVAVSQSGSSPDLVLPTERARAAGAITVAITNDMSSPLVAAAQCALDVLAGAERAVAATKTYTAELLTLFLFTEALGEREGREADALPERAQRILHGEDLVKQVARRYCFAEQILVTARGYNYATARETALKIMEATGIPAIAFSGADLLHGPMAMVDRGFPVIAIVSNGPGGQALLPVLDALDERRADVLVVGDGARDRRSRARLDTGILEPESISPLLAILPLQQLALHLSRERGLDPDHPQGLQKITRTW